MRECRLFGIRLTAGEQAPVLAELLRRAQGRRPGYVCLANVDMLTRARHRPALAATLDEAALVLTDGLPLVWALRGLLGLRGVDRLSGPSLSLLLLAQAEALDLPVFFYGGSEAELARLLVHVRQRFPALPIAGAESPPLLPEEPPEDPAALARIQTSGARLVFVGLGCPKQEFWMRRHAPRLDALCLGVGYAFPLLAGTLRRAPAWMQRSGLEWLYRLAQEPRRLWRRYLLGNSQFLGLCLAALPGALWRRLRGG
ncbi:WecB/TagA/CpsF family glycosyltransferase [Mitsuaria sp. WAJ17]|uniref:WecB/TagA/CpsF family glycosyltransferase n=1 Tax=Mitsuaria sp. WAJ17 TaxID=2761452 RepID=UPI0015FFE765|nr:WecB/TagA/CpsF family glycosyltransferase [Mitsuaria sp. WAJ17]MBB2484314.1 WecB/TagA/CpsF family glycosyltransferase [Mitsuaria sp. WAJ17]